MIVNSKLINEILESATGASYEKQKQVVERAAAFEKLDYNDIAVLLTVKDKDLLTKVFEAAGELKKRIYGNRIVMFAPLYISNFCVNSCRYCGFQECNSIVRRKLTMQEIQDEVRVLEKMGHKRLALEAGEDPVNCDIDYVLGAIDAIYSTKLENGSIRRVNVNIAATTVDEYRRLKDKGIGTYILFQETYNKEAYEYYHTAGFKMDYEYHLNAFDRAMEAGIDDVGAGVLFGLYKPEFEVLALMMHNDHLEKRFGAGFHTISMPRLKPAEGVNLSLYPHLVDDEMFRRLVAIIRLAVPFTGIIMSTRETAQFRRELLHYGVSQVSAGSCTGIGGYKEQENAKKTEQFEVSDERTPMEILRELLADGYTPSYCTACYRQGRTGDRFMQLAKSGNIGNICTPNALMTLMEYLMDYADKETLEIGEKYISEEIAKIARDDVRNLTAKNIERIKNGERDLYL